MDYNAPFPFTVAMKKALVDVTGEPVEEMAAKMRIVPGPPLLG